MKKSRDRVVALLATLALVAAVQRGEAVNCGQVDTALAPCLDFLSGRGEHPTRPCCDGVRSVKGMAITPADKKATCACVKSAATHLPGLKDTAAQSLPFECQVTLDIPISRTVDCDRIGSTMDEFERQVEQFYMNVA